MTISNERFEQLALEVALEQARIDNPDAPEGDTWDDETKAFIVGFAHALIKRVEADSDLMTEYGVTTNAIALPLVEE